MPKYYLLDENKNLVEVVNIEDNLFRTRLEKLHSDINNSDHSIEFVTQAQFNQLEAQGELVANTYYFITDDTSEEDLENSITQLDERLSNQEATMASLFEGDSQVARASVADYAETIAQELYLHDIWLEYKPSAQSYTYEVAFRLLTTKEHKTIANTISAITSVIEDIYGYEAKIPASGGYKYTQGSVTSQAVIYGVVLYNNDFRAIFHSLSDKGGVSLENANSIEVKTIRLI